MAREQKTKTGKAAKAERRKEPGASPADADSRQSPAAPHDQQWREHEHRAPETDAQAQQLLHAAGSEELAKHAVEQAVETAPPAEARERPPTAEEQDAAARTMGYDDFQKLLADSTPFPVERGRTLSICELNDGRWIRFDRETFPKHDTFPTREEAMQSQKGN